MSYCSIHTFEISRELSKNEYWQFRNCFYEAKLKIISNDDKSYLSVISYANEGVRIRLMNRENLRYIFIVINLQEVIDNGNLVDIIHPADLETAFDMLEGNLKMIIGPGFNFSYYKLSRLDFCTNIDIGEKEKVQEYLRIFNFKIGNRSGYKIEGRNSKRKDTLRGFCGTNASHDTQLAVYDKEEQLIYINRSEQAEAARGIIRLEYRLTSTNAVNEHTDGCNTIREKIMYCVTNSAEIMYNALQEYEPQGTYLKLKAANKRIDNSDIRNRHKTRAKTLLMLIAMKHNIKTAKKELMKSDPRIKSEAYNKILSYLQILDINLVTLGTKSIYKKLPALYSLIK